jgi:DNA-binding NarL/FixJ family response regulator
MPAIRSSTYPRGVTTLAERDATAVLAFVGDLNEVDDPLPFPPRLLRRLNDLVPSDGVWYSELDPLRRRSIIQVESSSTGEQGVLVDGQGADPSAADLWWRLRSSHPVCGHRLKSGDWTTPLKVSDFATLREFRRTAIYEAFYRGAIERWLDVGLPASPARTRVFIFARQGSDFEERDRLVLKLLRPHLEARHEVAENAAQAASALAAVEDGASDEARRVVLCSSRGVIEFASQSSRRLLERYLDVENGRLPERLLDRQELVVTRSGRRLTVRIARVGALHVLLLGESDARLEKLTPRERQILDRVAHGKANDEIAVELRIASATVAKHLEHVYEKLGVRNRTAAAALLDVD